jgi:hypothetical protein
MVREVLEFQTEQFLRSHRTEADLFMLKKEISAKRPEILFPVIYNCEFMGFIDRDRKKVGCLLHPSLNNGKNLRWISHHGKETCDESRCTAYFYLRDAEALLVAETVDDWYLYGLCVTDLDLVKEFFNITSVMLSDNVNAEKVRSRENLKEIFQQYLLLKERWKFSRNGNRFGKYVFKQQNYLIHRIDYASLSANPSRFDKIFNSLGSEFKNKSELIEAEELLEQIFQRFAENF